MESANLHQLQDQLLGSSSLANYPSCYGVGSTHAWTPNSILNSGNLNPNINGSIINSRQQNGSMIQDLGLHWPSINAAHDLHLARTKEELSDCCPKFSEMSIQDFHLHQTSYVKNEQNDLSHDQKLLLRTFPNSGCQLSAGAGDHCYSNTQNCDTTTTLASSFSQIFPSVNISNLNQAISSPLDMNLKALDLFTSARLCGNLSQLPSQGHLGIFKESLSYAGFDHMQHSQSNKMSPFTNGLREAKRRSSVSEPKAPPAAAKKSRLESRASCPPFKVRKEKLGDRIAALQQLVAPFGKTDTASVLMEAIGYIKFLQNQVETLNVPYMKSSRNKIISRTTQEGSKEDGKEEGRRDLRSRGLCLVPLSCLSYVTADGGGVWPSPNFCGGT
uniref:BHLH domain-containing protein n=1 Tax=Davidia involucrata TaxID=16924 RepID=A0A5B6YK87_DAVIN